MNLQLPPVHPPGQFLPPDLPQRDFWRQIFPELVLLWASCLLIGVRIAASLAVPEALGAITLAALVALSTSWGRGQLALRSHQIPIPPWQDFAANLLLGLAKLTAAAALLLELARYGLYQIPQADSGWLLPIALLALLGLTVATGFSLRTVQRPARSWVWLVPVGLMLLGLGWIELMRLGALRPVELVNLNQTPSPSWANLLQTTALLSVAYASYDPLSLPAKTTAAPTVRLTLKTLTIALGLGWLLFSGVAILANSSAAPILLAAPGGFWDIVWWVTLGAIVTLTGALLILLPQLTRQLLRLGQEVSTEEQRQNPVSALVSLSLILVGLLLVGDLQSLWSFSAFAGLMQAALVQWAILTSAPSATANRQFRRQASIRSGLRLPLRSLTLRKCFQGLRLAVCLLAFWVEWQVWLVSLSLIALGLIWRGMTRWTAAPTDD